jgi:SAM-dependent methyltransferase
MNLSEPSAGDIYWDGRHYDLQHRDFTEDVPFYLDQARSCGDPVLELACGTGRIAIPLAAAGFDVTGLDLSPSMLRTARRKAEEGRVGVRWVEADCRRFDLGRTFNLILFPFNSMAHLHDLESIEASLGAVRRHLDPAGRFILDHFNPRLDILIRNPSERYPVAEYDDPDGRGKVVITENNIYDGAAQINHIRWYYRINGGKESIRSLDLRIYYPRELDALLKYNGFEIESKMGDVNGEPFTSKSPRQLVICRRRV